MSDQRRSEPGVRTTLVALGVAAVGVVAVHLVRFDDARLHALAVDLAPTLAALVAGSAILRSRRRKVAWASAGYLGLGVLGITAVDTVLLVSDLNGSTLGPSPLDLAFIPIGALFLIPVKIEFDTHLPKGDRGEIATDVALIAVALGSVGYVMLRPDGAGPMTTVSSAILAILPAAGVTAYGALATWVPSPAHLWQFSAIATLSAGIVAFGADWVRGDFVSGAPALDIPFSMALLALGVMTNVIPRHSEATSVARPARLGRALLTVVAVVAASAALALISAEQTSGRVAPRQGSILIAILAASIALRILVNQFRSVRATRQVETALSQKEAALKEIDVAMAQIRDANETLRRSEEHLRLVFDAAVDGIVELDEHDVIRRTNEAFCRMVGLSRTLVEGQPWTALAAAVEGADDTFALLPERGEAQLRREGSPLYLEARTSSIPGTPLVKLMLVRDVTPAKVAEQTIRSLFKFLQDRDEDRTRIMRRINSAIEAERNRIARDLHDGPVQGVSAASLSLEAALLMIKAGELDEGLELLNKVRKELSEEADNVRRLMAGLRPPLLEERGLVPALREMLGRFGADHDVETDFITMSPVELPADLETLAYRIVQEALSNAAKHAKASRVTVGVEISGGQLRVEVADDGVGFEPARAREFLQMGRVGLASMRERIELANGTFAVHSTPGRGATILATLPVEAATIPHEQLAVREA